MSLSSLFIAKIVLSQPNKRFNCPLSLNWTRAVSWIFRSHCLRRDR